MAALFRALWAIIKNWRVWLGFAVRIGGVLLTAWLATESLYSMGDWMFGNFASVFERANEYINTTASSIDEFVADVETPWIVYVVHCLELKFFVTSLIGWGAFAFLILQYTLIGGSLTILAICIRLFAIKWKQKQLENVKQSTSGIL